MCALPLDQTDGKCIAALRDAIINIGSMVGLVGTEPLNYLGTDLHGWHPDYFFHKGGMTNLTRFRLR